MSERSEKAVELFKSGYNCSQAVFAAYADMFGFDTDTALKVSAGLGGGVGRSREVCGTVSAAAMLLGELLGLSQGENSHPKPDERTEAYYKKRPCVQIVEDSALALEKILSEEMF